MYEGCKIFIVKFIIILNNEYIYTYIYMYLTLFIYIHKLKKTKKGMK